MRLAVILTICIGFILGCKTKMIASEKIVDTKPAHWKLLGSKKVSKKLEKDVFYVGNSYGKFSKLKIKVTGGTVFMTRMTVIYGNGEREVIPLKYKFKKGSTSRVIDLNGYRRHIKKVTFLYDRVNRANRAKVWVAGK